MTASGKNTARVVVAGAETTMYKRTHALMALLTAVSFLTGCATSYDFKPLAVDGTSVTYDHGVPVTASSKLISAVQVQPLEINKQGRLVLGVAATNRSNHDFNFGVENVSVLDGAGNVLRVYTQAELVRQAKNRATWAAVAMEMSGAAAAYAANRNAYSTTTGYINSPRGITNFSATSYDPGAAAAGVAAASVATGAGLYAINEGLNNAISHYRGRVLQVTTIRPGNVYGGEVHTQRIALSKSAIVSIKVLVEGDEHEFRYKITKQGG